ncbi:hypothetical protein [Telluria aromaticivorans]|uniref:Uncharacterized protein n=1 Tax=Telluria aromaticivorans TaxID=2725995 RepID=A0A7Y2NZJ1_9BURK|nr:hypothetical protein [Telluria aromaticivorans]NNG22541.1 hypothetical protein [Telluria aromaticivorans]
MTTSTLPRALSLAAVLAAFAACAVPGQANATSFTSSASSAGSASSGSVSDSIGSSSNSSGDDKKVAAGEYRVIDVAQAPAKPNTTRMTLRAVAAGAAREFHLDVPNRALAQRPVNAGELVQVSERAYGYEFAHADTRRSFFLALQDDWYRDLGSRKVTI